ncbi:hypothetical protein AM501_30750 [Aneurinibacillus migulanus]|uniref:Radical SAM core domain-containing protein n=1 Tax=Aneurinibacillus migulanus TaxID=47500 RepID=A0A0D1W5U9_ANEMI|nr:radical SAM protein [Aneurinibacillus migulanus]KIV53790.1 hypothetical protein TS64_17855 [Aneurinibacillus migulanus]KIV58742.1 hypothetical protein TS65_05070 [Aneurinibacillus migulanus]KON96433.1 hypothetical protein AF333_14060 [Aneurinibacillus migulanus]KPD04655.1 hypothetical protein AM501_30750 [Aneurinibacillus migulanus]MCP1356897.1 SPASM domain-containing protein [Aneurinibacillus migulanus]
MSTIRLSNYIDFEVDGHPYLFHGLTGTIIALDNAAADIVSFAKQNGKHIGDSTIFEVEAYLGRTDCWEEHREALQELVNLEILQYESKSSERGFALTPPTPKHTERMPVKTLVVHLVNECNLRCTYCYAGDGEYGAPKKYLSREVAEQAVRFLMENSYGEKEVTFVLFGGEPFLNWEVLKYLVEYGSEQGRIWGKKVNYSLTTNGTLLSEEKIRFLEQYRVGVSVSMDGTKEAHDRHRLFAGGQGSYEKISRNVSRLMEGHRSAPVGSRVTVSKGFEKVEKSLVHLLAKGFYEVGFAPVTETDDHLALDEQDMRALLGQFEDIAGLYVDYAVNDRYLGFSNLTNLLKELHIGTNKAYGCGAGLGFFAVSPDGGLYLCHRFNEDERFKLGDIYEGVNRRRQREMLDELHVDRKESCATCALKHICSGGCYYEAMERQGDYRRPNAHYCDWMHEWITVGLVTYVQIMEKNPVFLDRIAGIGKEGCVSN